MLATIVIVTKNRRNDLRRAIASAVAQQADVETLVVDDGSTDETAKMVADEFPGVRFYRSESSLGYIAQRNRSASLANGEFIFSIDDDAEFSTPAVVAQTLAEFSEPCIGAVAIPYVEPYKDNVVFQKSPHPREIWLTDMFRGTAYAVRRDVFLALGGYREHLVHQGEEMDFCIRLLQDGMVTRLGTADVIRHFESPKRDTRRMDYYGRRNDILFAGNNVPFPALPLHLAATTMNGLRMATRATNPGQMVLGLLAGYRDLMQNWSRRKPTPQSVYRLQRRLKKAGPIRLSEIAPLLPALAKA